MGDNLSDFFDGYIEQFADTTCSPHIFSVLDGELTSCKDPLVSNKSISNSCSGSQETKSRKRQKLSLPLVEQKAVSHIAVERNRRKQMNEHLTVLRSLMPCFYVKRGDQASIIGGVVDYITELQQVLQSLESKKQRKAYSDHVLSPRKPPLSPLPISPRTPQPVSPYRAAASSCSWSSNYLPSPSSSSNSASNYAEINVVNNNDLVVANSKSAIADVEAKFSGSNLVLKTISPWLPGQATKIVSLLEEDLSLEILQAGINTSTVDQTMVNSFTIKIGIECKLSAEDLVQQIQQTFC